MVCFFSLESIFKLLLKKEDLHLDGYHAYPSRDYQPFQTQTEYCFYLEKYWGILAVGKMTKIFPKLGLHQTP